MRSAFLILAGAVFAACLSAGAFAQHRPIQRINPGGFNPNGNNQQDGITVANAGPRWVAVYAEQNGTAAATQDVWSTVSNDDGLTWALPVRVDNGDAPNSHDSQFPKVGICADGTIVCAWEETRDAATAQSTNQDVFFNRSLDGGVTWQPVSIALNSDTAGNNVASDIDRIAIAITGNDVYVTWEEDRSGIGGPEDIYFVASHDSGATFSLPLRINTVVTAPPSPLPHNDVDEPSIAASGSNIVVAFADDRSGNDDIWVTVSHDSGVSWTEILLDTDPTGDVDFPLAIVDGNTFVVSWRDEGAVAGGQVHTSSSFDGGATWSQEVNVTPLNTTTPADQEIEYPHAAITGSTVYATWVSDRLSPTVGATSNGLRKTYVSVSYDGGLTWLPEIGLDAANPSRKNHFTRVAADGPIAYVWFETGNFGANDNAYSYTLDAGLNWTTVDVPSPGDTDSPDQAEGTFFAMSRVSKTAIGVYNNNPLGQNEVYALSFRVPFATTVGTPTAGAPFNFGVRGVADIASNFTFLMVISGTGTAPATDIGGGLLAHIVIDPLTILGLADPTITPILSGVIPSTLGGDTPTIPFPLPPGLSIYAIGAVFNGNGGVAFLTDPITVAGI